MKAHNKQKEYIFMWSMVPIMPSFWASSCALKKRSGIYSEGGSIFSYYDGKILTSYMPKEDVEVRKRRESKKYLNPKFFKKYLLRYQKEKKQWWIWIRKIEKKDYSKVTMNQLRKDHLKFQEYTNDALVYFGSTRPEFTYQAEQKLEKILKKYFRNNWADIFGILVDALELDDVQKEYLERLKLLSGKVTKEKILLHVSYFPWLVFGQIEEKKVLSFLEKIFHREKEDYKDVKDKLEREKKELRRKQEKIYKQLEKDRKEAKYLASFLQKQSIERMNIKSYWAGCYYLARNMWSKIAEVLGLRVNDFFKFITPPEIQQLLSNKYPGDIKKVISLRKKSFAIDYQKGKEIKILNYKEADALFKKRIKKKANKARIIKGQTVSLGVYKGKVRKIIAGDLEILQKSIKTFKEGEVLVTSMTQPNMMIIAKRAGAIIVDEGGITSHAAIIARELKIPCIVGCLKATEILGDGDLIEVDANKGIVRILKRKR